jgi:four helix bundle protein
MDTNKIIKKPIRSYYDLDVYQLAYETSITMMTEIIPRLPESEKYDMKDQLARSCKAVPRLIAEGFAKKHQRAGFQKYLDDATGEANETQVGLCQCRDIYAKYIDVNLCEKLIDTYDKIGRQLFNLKQSWNKFGKIKTKDDKRITKPVATDDEPLTINSTGFTLLEVIAAIFILTVGIGSAFILISQTLSATSLAKERLIASYLAQEGIEIVRNIRDTNWLQFSPWDDGLICALPPCHFQADYTTRTFTETANNEKCTDPGYNCHLYDGTPLKIDGGFYNYTSGSETKFKREIIIEEPSTTTIKVEVNIEWAERGRVHNFKTLEYLTNWYEK